MDLTKIIIFGKNGQVGSNLVKLFSKESDFDVQSYSSHEIDFSNLENLKDFLDALVTKPDFIINCAAYTNVDKAEEERELADLINHQAVEIIAKYCAKNHVKLIHYSTDYVFDGSGDRPFSEDNTQNLNPVNYYGETKLRSERAIINSGCEYLIFRISWLWDENPDAKNFVNTIKRLAREREVLTIVDDQIGSPTKASFVAENTIRIIKKFAGSANFPSGIYHLNNGEFIAWYGFALRIIDDLKKSGEDLKIQKVVPVKTSEYKTTAKRPLNSRLDSTKIKAL
ncbi:MAG: dTDP-4-dehydrorhamnose reductase [Rickettsiaceae bacterium]|jgi:dTDP-4-dehydrorhamnose reductase|nr:dTDP-4-dehydrorhamnose reductase [Rickettsiaceae bacterium]